MKKNTVTHKDIEKLLAEAEVFATTIFDKTTVVAVKLKNGFVITDSSSCVDPENYDFELGKSIVMKRIENKLWELEGYVLQNSI